MGFEVGVGVNFNLRLSFNFEVDAEMQVANFRRRRFKSSPRGEVPTSSLTFSFESEVDLSVWVRGCVFYVAVAF